MVLKMLKSFHVKNKKIYTELIGRSLHPELHLSTSRAPIWLFPPVADAAYTFMLIVCFFYAHLHLFFFLCLRELVK